MTGAESHLDCMTSSGIIHIHIFLLAMQLGSYQKNTRWETHRSLRAPVCLNRGPSSCELPGRRGLPGGVKEEQMAGSERSEGAESAGSN